MNPIRSGRSWMFGAAWMGMVVLAFLALSPAPVLAQDGCNYAGFAGASGLTMVGNSAIVGSTLRLTTTYGNQDGAAWCAAKPAVAGGFETVFAFRITDPANGGADGIAFVIQNAQGDALGTLGYGIGYDGIPNSLAVEFDTWTNSWDPDGNHISVNTNGVGANGADHLYSLGVTSAIPNLSDGAVHLAKIAYVPGALRIYLDNFAAPVLTVSVDLSTKLSLDSGRAWVGFTASSGGAWENHDILLWGFSNSGSCSLLCSGAVPDTAAYATPVPFAALAAPLYCDHSVAADWDFGDGTEHSASPFTDHYYATTGTYTWTVNLTGGGLSCSKSGTITVTPTLRGACADVPPMNSLGETIPGTHAQGAEGSVSCDDGTFPGEGLQLGGWPGEGRAWFDFAAGSPGEALEVTLDWLDDASLPGWKELDVYDWQARGWRTATAWNGHDDAGHIISYGVCLEPGEIGFMGKVRLGVWASSDANLHLRSLKASEADVSSLILYSVAPARGGNGGRVSVHVDGAGFGVGASAALKISGSPDIPAAMAGVDPCGLGLSAQFDLQGATPGTYDLVVTNPGSSPVTLPGAFTVEVSRPPDLWVDVVGRAVLRGGRAQTYYITYGNNGNQDAYAVPLWIQFPKWISCEVLAPIQTPPQNPAYPAVDYSQIPISYQTETETMVPLVILQIQPGVTGTLPIRLTASDDPQYAHAAFSIRATLSPPMLQASDLGRRMRESTPNDWTGCMFSIAGEALNIMGVVFPPADCAASIGAFALNNSVAMLGMATTGQAPNAASYEQLVAGMVSTLADCGTDLIPGAGQIANAVGVALGAKDVIDNCSGPLGDLAHAARGGEVVVSGDPNDKTGPPGSGDGHFLAAVGPMPYAIFFENKREATAPAQVVTVTDPLDASTMDLSTFALGPITVGTRVITPPPGLSAWSADVDLRPAMNLFLRIQAGLNRAASTATWTFTSLDPATMQLTEDPLLGFLPPDVTSPEGQASVLFTLSPKAGLPDATHLSNRATIVFDLNAPMDTPTWTNTLDTLPPSSAVQPLPAVETTPDFPVTWSGSDPASGVKDYQVYVSVNGGAFALWKDWTASTSATYAGADATTYAFYSVGRDIAGHIEAAPSAPDATTRVTLTPPPVVTSMQKLGSPFRIAVNGSNLQKEIRVYIGGSATPWASVKWKSAGQLLLKGGSALKAAVPKGTPTQFRFVNPDGGEVTLTWQRP